MFSKYLIHFLYKENVVNKYIFQLKFSQCLLLHYLIFSKKDEFKDMVTFNKLVEIIVKNDTKKNH
ncbi:hypothetical protein DN406_10655 [Bacillus sp. BB56-3]|nr:hypothetical protein DN406_10655 [Bacillus sp. BB56-3]